MTLASPLTIALVNRSTVVADAAVAACAAALHTQLNRDFAPYWGVDGVVGIARAGAVLAAGTMPLYILDDSDQAGALGYHDNDPKLGPFGRVFAKTDARFGLNWTVTASHELLELAADPFIFYMAPLNRTSFTAVEVCDAVEADADGYVIDGVAVSDFVTPAWFGSGPGPVDFMKRLSRPFTLRKGGYMSVWRAGKWTQTVARQADGQVSVRAQRARRWKVRAERSLAQQFDVAEA